MVFGFIVPGLLWTAPEYITSGVSNLDEIIRITPQGDIYSFGIILSEIISRRPPYSEITVMTIPHIVQAVGHLREPIASLDQMNKADPGGQNIEKVQSKLSLLQYYSNA